MGGRVGGWAVERTREGLTAEVNLEITTTARRGEVINQPDLACLSPKEEGGGGGGGGGWGGGIGM